MGRRAKPKNVKVDAKRRLARKPPTVADAKAVDLEKRLAEALEQLQASDRERAEAQEQQAATAEILRVISQSPTDVQPVFETIVRCAVQLCDGVFSIAGRFDGEYIHLGAEYNFSPEALAVYRRWFPRRAAEDRLAGRAVLERRVMNVADVTAEFRFVPGQQEQGFRSVIFVPMVRDGVSIGVIGVSRTAVGVFPEQQVGLLQTFADQAVIAIENVRLFTELQEKNRALTQAHAQVTESLDQQTATAEILRVISSSPTDIQPVLDTIAASAARVCNAFDAIVLLPDGGDLVAAAHHGSIPARADLGGRAPIARDWLSGRAFLDGRTVHVHDMLETESEYPRGAEMARRDGHRTTLATPLVRQGTSLGVLLVRRTEVLPFSDEQTRLLQTFADQAVIAIENVRLFTELQQRNAALTRAHAQVTESLEQQTATSDILRVISQSPTDVQPVFDAVASSAARLCEASDSGIFRLEGDRLRLVAHHGPMPYGPVGEFSIPVIRGMVNGRAVLEGRPAQVADLSSEIDEYPESSAIAREWGVRTILSVPLTRDGLAIGVITLWRTEVQLFTGRQIALLQTFADQAVIAIENVRLFTELQTSNRELRVALDQQTATSEILRVISRSPTDVQPVFDSIVASAVRLLGAYSGSLTRKVGDQIALASLTSTDDAGDAAVRARYPQPLRSEDFQALALRDRAPLNIADARTDPRLPEATRAYARARGWRSAVMVPLIRHGDAVGTISVTRRDPGGFTDDEIALLDTFADQAVIAIENARLLSELQARTQQLTRSVEQLTALGDVGRAVSSSLDLDIVLTTIVGRAVQLSSTDGGTIFEYDEGTEEFAPRATLNADEGQSAMLRATRLRRGEGAVGQLALSREPIQIPDMAAEGAYAGRLRGALLEAGTRAILAIPLLHEERIVGASSSVAARPASSPPRWSRS